MSSVTKPRKTAARRTLDLDAAKLAKVERNHYAIIDIGSNSVRLVVYDGMGRAPLPRFNEKSLCRLGECLAQTGAIAPENFGRTVEALRRFRAIADAMGVDRIDATATEAMRRASNGPELQRLIERETGLSIRILSGAEEARFAALGVVPGLISTVIFALPAPSAPASSGPGASWATWAAAASRWRKRSTTGSASAGSACRSAPYRSRR